MIGGSDGAWWFDMFMWVSDCRIGWLVGLIGDRWLGLQIARYFLGFDVLVGQSCWIREGD